MKKKSKGMLSYYSVLFFLIVTLAACSQTLKVTVLHLNDSHSHLDQSEASIKIDNQKIYVQEGGMPRTAAKILEIQKEKKHVLLLQAGDAVQGTLYFTKYHGKPEIEMLNAVSCAAMVTGNHEFDKGTKVLSDMIAEADFPFLAANVNIDISDDLRGKILPYVIKKIGHQKVAIVGLVTPETAEISNAGDSVVFDEILPAAQKAVSELKAQKINKIILLTHIGYEQDIQLAQSLDDVDVIIGGHTHTFLGDFSSIGMSSEGSYPTIVSNPSGNPVYIAHAGEHLQLLGSLDIVFNRKGIVKECSGYPQILIGDQFLIKNEKGEKKPVNPETAIAITKAVDQSPVIQIAAESPAIIDQLRSYKDGINELKKQMVGQVEKDLWTIRIPGHIHPMTGIVMTHGSQITPLVADSFFWKANQLGIKADMAIQNAGSVRIDLAAGDLTFGDIYELLPFENTMFVLDIQGQKIKECFESLIDRIQNPDNDGAFPYTSNMKFTIDMNQPSGNRLTKMEIKDANCNWIPLDPDKEYRVVTNAYLASGKDGYDVLSQTTGYRSDTGYLDAEIFVEYVEAHNPLKMLSEPLVTFIPLESK